MRQKYLQPSVQNHPHLTDQNRVHQLARKHQLLELCLIPDLGERFRFQEQTYLILIGIIFPLDRDRSH